MLIITDLPWLIAIDAAYRAMEEYRIYDIKTRQMLTSSLFIKLVYRFVIMFYRCIKRYDFIY